jgi:hypothetical protein
VLRLIVNRTDEALRILKAAGCTVSATDVLAVSIGHQPGSLAKALAALGLEVTVEYCYAFISRDPKRAKRHPAPRRQREGRRPAQERRLRGAGPPDDIF